MSDGAHRRCFITKVHNVLSFLLAILEGANVWLLALQLNILPSNRLFREREESRNLTFLNAEWAQVRRDYLCKSFSVRFWCWGLSLP